MRESSTYQAIFEEGLEEGRVQQAWEVLNYLGNRRFGMPSPQIQSQLESASGMQIRCWVRRVLDVESWEDLLATGEAQ